jgi:N-acyl-D-aspartate/D-glutamate deacylase
MTYDLLIKGGSLLDGSGAPRYTADVGIRDGRIAAIGRLGNDARETVDADGLAVAPGIIDVHTHYDPQLTFEPLGTSSVWHGVTTVVGGNCGFTLAPCKPEDREYLARMFGKVEGMNLEVLNAGIPWSWESFPEFLDTLDQRLGINALCYVGHSALRRYVLGEDANERRATEEEIRRMRDLLREAMAAGAAGFTSSLAATHVDGDDRPVPSRGADHREIVELTSVLGELNAGTIQLNPASVMQGIDDREREWLVEVSLTSGRPVLSVGFSPRTGDPEKHVKAYRFLEDASRRGARIISQVRNHPSDRPFNFAGGPTLETLPAQALDQTPTWRALLAAPEPERLKMLRDPDIRARLRDEVDHPNLDPSRGRMLPPPRWRTISVARVAKPANKPAEGRNIAELAAEQGRHLADVMLDLILDEDLETEFFYSGRLPEEEEPFAEVLSSRFTMVGTSDGGAHLERDDGADWSTYFLWRWVGQKGIMPLEQAISRMTFFPATVMGIHDRGLLRPGFAADLMLFDEREVRPVSKHQLQDFPGGGVRYVTVPNGITHTIVNGQVVVDHGRHTGAYPGRVLRPART